MKIQFAILAVALLNASPVAAQDRCTTASGSERTAILDVIRAPVANDLNSTVEFVVERARICGGWAFVIATPQRKDGKTMRWSGTPCAGDTSHLVGGLVRRSADGWQLVDYALCPSDVAWYDWPQKYKAPQALFDE